MFEYGIMIFLVMIIIVLIMVIRKQGNYINMCHKEWVKWETEYWTLRNSDAIDTEKYEVRLSWLPIGDRSIRKR